jgi:DNA end-binding protein Ku
MAPRAIWTGSITFGLVNVPVRVYSAIHEKTLRFNLLHAPDDGPIGYQKICKLEDEPVPDDEIVRAYEIEKGEYVHMTDEDFEAVRVEGAHTFDLEDFVPYEQIDPTFFSHTYLVGPQEGSERPYALLLRAMEESGLAGIGKFVMRSRQYLGCLRIRNGLLTLEQMYFADEVDAPESIAPDELPDVAKRELELALSLIERFSTDWEPEKYEDTYREALLDIVEQKRRGKKIHRVTEPEEEGPPDLMEALRQSLERAQRGRRPSRNGGRHDGDLGDLSKGELQERAKELDIPGRSKMSKDELAEAVAHASR